MADKKISQLTSATTPLVGTEQLPIVQGGSTVKTTISDITTPTEWLYVSYVNKVFRLDGTDNGKNKYTNPDDALNYIYWDIGNSVWAISLNDNEEYQNDQDTDTPESGNWTLWGDTPSVPISITRYTGTLQEVLEQISKPKEWPKRYRALVTQNGTNPPTAVVLENTLGATITYAYNIPGNYLLQTSDIFPNDKTFCIIANPGETGAGGTAYVMLTDPGSSDTLFLALESKDNLGNLANDVLLSTSLEILIYP